MVKESSNYYQYLKIHSEGYFIYEFARSHWSQEVQSYFVKPKVSVFIRYLFCSEFIHTGAAVLNILYTLELQCSIFYAFILEPQCSTFYRLS